MISKIHRKIKSFFKKLSCDHKYIALGTHVKKSTNKNRRIRYFIQCKRCGKFHSTKFFEDYGIEH